MTKRCLIVDDVEVSRYVIGETMSELGFDVKEAGAESEVLDMVRRERFDVIFLDWHLRKSDGLSLVPEIKKAQNASGTPIVVCTGVEMEKELQDIQNTGVQGLLKKPTSPEKIRAELKRIGLV